MSTRTGSSWPSIMSDERGWGEGVKRKIEKATSLSRGRSSPSIQSVYASFARKKSIVRLQASSAAALS